MKVKVLAVVTLVAVMCWACKKNPTTPDIPEPNYKLTDLNGTWKGATTSGSFVVNWTIEVWQGQATGSGTTGANCNIDCTWNINADTGKVTGGGSMTGWFASTSGIGSCSWDLQLSQDKKTLSGTFKGYSYSSMSTTLTKQ